MTYAPVDSWRQNAPWTGQQQSWGPQCPQRGVSVQSPFALAGAASWHSALVSSPFANTREGSRGKKSVMWACIFCPCKKNRLQSSDCKRCGKERAGPGFLPLAPRRGARGPPHNGAGGHVHRSTPDTSTDELKGLASMPHKCGDATGADWYQSVLDKKKSATRGLPRQQRIATASSSIRIGEAKLDKAAKVYEDMSSPRAEQQRSVASLSNELASAGLLHKSFLGKLHATVAAPVAPPSPPKKYEWFVRDLIAGEVAQTPLVVGCLQTAAPAWSLSAEGRQQAEVLVESFKRGPRGGHYIVVQTSCAAPQWPYLNVSELHVGGSASLPMAQRLLLAEEAQCPPSQPRADPEPLAGRQRRARRRLARQPLGRAPSARHPWIPQAWVPRPPRVLKKSRRAWWA
ncbi:unnamed protein product, partial [Prorocentrum cordatum]